jgi:DNA (cytosine-5)-methyltransferase 1
MNELKTAHLFAGHGGGLLADLILGHKPIVAVEWDAYACRVLRERAADGWFPGLRVWEGDVRLFDPSEYAGIVDCIHAGFPCQDISTAGKQAGIGPETRSGLYREVLRIAGVVRPRFLFLENVAAIVTNGLGTVLAELAYLGYAGQWTTLRASDCGATHERDRWWGLFSDTHSHQQSASAVHDEAPFMQGAASCHQSAYTDSPRCEEGRVSERVQPQHARNSGHAWWQTIPDLPRVANGMANQSHRLKGIGNGQCPLQAAAAFKILYDSMSGESLTR